METINSILKTENLVLGFGQPLHTDALSFSIEKNRFTALIGKNGSGKSTLLSVLCGGEGKLSGNVVIDKIPVAYLPQEHQYPSHFRAIDLLGMASLQRVGMWSKLPGKEDPEILSISKKLSIEGLLGKELGNMSSGERQRVFLARALLQKPQLLLLDEPTNHLDPGGVERFWNSLLNIMKEKMLTVIMSTHDISFVEKYADEVLALCSQGVFFQGTVEKFKAEKTSSKVFL